VLYGDSYLDIDYRAVFDAFRRQPVLGLMTVLRNADRWDRSNVAYRSGRVVLYNKSRVSSPAGVLRWIDHGISVLRRGLVGDRVPSGVRADLGDLMHRLSLEGLLAGVEMTERFYEAGSPAGLRDLERYLSLEGRLPAPVSTSQGTRASRARATSQQTSTHSGRRDPTGRASVTRT